MIYLGTPLHEVAKIGDTSQLDSLIKKHGIEARDGYYRTALHIAALFGQNAFMKALIERGANVNAKGDYCGTALQSAKTNEIIKILFENGVNT